MIRLPTDVFSIEQHVCPYCGDTVQIMTDERGRVHDHQSYLLVADWVYHSACWDRQIEEHPPFDPAIETESATHNERATNLESTIVPEQKPK